MMSISWFTIGFALVATVYTGLAFNFWTVGFFFVLAGSSYAALAGYTFGSLRPAKPGTLKSSPELFNIVIAVVSLIGIAIMLYDRTTNRGIDYLNLGLSAARAEFTRVGERGGMLSVAGNIMSASIYLPLINMIFDWERWGRLRGVVAILVVAGLLGLTYISGGRTALLIAIAIGAAAMLGRGALGLPRLPSFLSTTRLVIAMGVMILMFGGIFALRAEAFGSVSSAEYLGQLCIHLSQPAIEIMSQCYTMPYMTGVRWLDDVANFGTAVLLYAFHVAWVGDVIITDVNPGVASSFTGFQGMFLSRFGYEILITDYDGYFIPASSGLIYDFGYLAMIFGFGLLGLLLGVSRQMVVKGRQYSGRVLFSFVGASLILCVLISPANLPTMLLAVMATGICAVVAKLFEVLGIGSTGMQVARVAGTR